MFVDFTHAERAMLDEAIPHAPANLAPLLMAVRDHGLAFTMVVQSRMPFKVPEAGPAVVIIGDDMAEAFGPTGFHVRSLRRVVQRASIVAVMSGEAMTAFYARMAKEAVERGVIAVLIETQITHEVQWFEYINETAPNADAHLVSPTVAGLLQ